MWHIPEKAYSALQLKFVKQTLECGQVRNVPGWPGNQQLVRNSLLSYQAGEGADQSMKIFVRSDVRDAEDIRGGNARLTEKAGEGTATLKKSLKKHAVRNYSGLIEWDVQNTRNDLPGSLGDKKHSMRFLHRKPGEQPNQARAQPPLGSKRGWPPIRANVLYTDHHRASGTPKDIFGR